MIFHYLARATPWLTPAFWAVGLGVSLLAFHTTQKRGYLLVAAYFCLALFTVFATFSGHTNGLHESGPSQAPVLEGSVEDHPLNSHRGTPSRAVQSGRIKEEMVEIPLDSLLLVVGLWMIARKDRRMGA